MTRTTPTLAALASTLDPGSPSLLYAETSSLLQAGTTQAEGDRRTSSTFVLYSDASLYRLRSIGEVDEHLAGGSWTVYGKRATTWDASFRVPQTSETWFDGDDTHRAIARTVYDLSTGNVLEQWKPVQNEAGTTKRVFTYDARKLFVVTDINEVGLELDFEYDYGTGTKIKTSGPNVRSCTTNCPNDAAHPVKGPTRPSSTAWGAHSRSGRR